MASVKSAFTLYNAFLGKNRILGLILLISLVKIWIEHTHLLLLVPLQKTNDTLPPLLRPEQPASHVLKASQHSSAVSTTTSRNTTTTTTTTTAATTTSANNVLAWWKDTDNNKLLPAWMKTYFAWHQESLRQLHNGSAHAESFHYLVLRCLQRNKKCSGASDRLRTIPTALLLAHASHRLLFIVWDKPAPLEAFLVPPPPPPPPLSNYGLDWRLPEAVEATIRVRNVTGTWLLTNETGRDLPNVTDRVVCLKAARGEQYYNEHQHQYLESSSEHELDFLYDKVFRHVWKVFFQPSPAVQAQINKQFQLLQLQPGQYVAAHVRALYQSNAVEQHEEINAIHCASQLAVATAAIDSGGSNGGRNGRRHVLPIYFASDSNRTVAFAREYGKSIQGIHVVSRASDREPLHLDRGRDFLTKAADEWRNHTASDFYDIFVDLYILSMARCITHGIGGYGKLAVLLSGNQSCSMDHRKTKCAAAAAADWRTATTTISTTTNID
jgi:hypothetical protein